MPQENEPSPFPDREPAEKKERMAWDRNIRIYCLSQIARCAVGLLLIAGVMYVASDVLDYVRSRGWRPNASKLSHARSKPPARPPFVDSEFRQQMQQHRATGAYWKVAVAELHPYRFLFLEDPNEPAGQFYRRLVRNLETKVQAARTHSTENVDKDLVKMVTRHLNQDDEALRLLRRVGDLAEARGFLDSPKSVEQQTSEAAQLAADLTDDPGRLDQIEDPESRALVEALYQMDVMRMEQLREIELMQARLQERHLLTSFALPSPPE